MVIVMSTFEFCKYFSKIFYETKCNLSFTNNLIDIIKIKNITNEN